MSEATVFEDIDDSVHCSPQPWGTMGKGKDFGRTTPEAVGYVLSGSTGSARDFNSQQQADTSVPNHAYHVARIQAVDEWLARYAHLSL